MEPVKDTYRGGDDLINMYSIYGIKMTQSSKP
jgi:hypothetical protein